MNRPVQTSDRGGPARRRSGPPRAVLALFLAALAAAVPGRPAAAGPLLPAEPQLMVGPNADAKAHLHAAAAALQKHDLAKADAEYHAAAAAAPTAPDPLVGLADVAMRRGDRKGAREDLDKALKLAPASPLAHSAMGAYLWATKDLKGAQGEFDKAAALDPKSAKLRLQQGNFYAAALRDAAGAEQAYRAAIALAPKDAATHFALGSLLLQTRKLPEAKAELKEATQLAPNNPLGWTLLGAAEQGLGEYDDALRAFDAASKIAPKFLGPRIARGEVLLAQGRTDAAIDTFKEALKIDGHATTALLHLAMAESKAGHQAEAEDAYRAVLKYDPRNVIALNDLAYMLAIGKRDLDNALTYAKTASQLAPAAANIRDTLAWVYRARGDLPAAAKVLAAIPEKSANAEILYHLGIVDAGMGNMQAARTAFDKALKLAPGYAAAKEARAKLGP
ncbi:MAG: tetratricopeptide repeat protein [Stellaceae bacterium]